MKDADIQFLTLQHYKLPLVAVPRKMGVGYYGALSVTMDGSKVQCHICGRLFKSLALHVRQAHMPIKEYRQSFELAPTTALISETYREEMKVRRLEWNATHKIDYKKLNRMANKARLDGRAYTKGGSISLETKNKRGTCPDQLLAKIHEVTKKLGHTPSVADFIEETGGQRYIHLIRKAFGSWHGGLRMANLQPKERAWKYGTYNDYTNEELLEYLVNFAQETGRIPTSTDAKRRLIPYEAIYRRRFGSLPKARELAGVYNFVERDAYMPKLHLGKLTKKSKTLVK